jgi:hypothetical protein
MHFTCINVHAIGAGMVVAMSNCCARHTQPNLAIGQAPDRPRPDLPGSGIPAVSCQEEGTSILLAARRRLDVPPTILLLKPNWPDPARTGPAHP